MREKLTFSANPGRFCLRNVGIFAAALLVIIVCPACEQPAGIVLDGDAALKSLSVNAGILSPAFNASHFEYRVTVRNAIDSVTVAAQPASGKAQVTGTGEKPLTQGGNTITVGVRAENGSRTDYIITVTRLDASVKEIESAADMEKIGVVEGWSLAGEYALVNDIALENWTGVHGDIFSGVFDGNGYIITLNGLCLSSNVLNQSGGNTLAGIFPRIGGSETSRAGVKNLVIDAAVNIEEAARGHISAGLIAGYAAQADFENITIRGNISVKNTGDRKRLYLGGIAGMAAGTSISGCKNEAAIYGYGTAGSGVYNQAGGIVGMFHDGTDVTDCHNSGNITGVTSGGGTNMFVGGIAGGSFYDMSTAYYGKIEACSSTGNIHSEGGGYWSWAGGIAGTIVGGGGPATGPTRIVRSRASGRISVKGPAGSWPYVGGVTAYNYYGAHVEQCYFEGDVVVEGGNVNDYAGGIAGYNSRFTGYNSTIQDCWSSGTVTGFLNAGGIAGQNQIETILRRCYSRSMITVTGSPGERADMANQGAGGIAGFSVSKETDAVLGCVALNPSVSAPNGFPSVGRVVGTNNPVYVAGGFEDQTAAGVMRNNYASTAMLITVNGVSKNLIINKNGIDGATCLAKPPQSLYEGLGWDFVTVWKMGGDGYPALRWQE
jgi:hypothetical protein